ncbi:MAG: DUF3307 domain-containing protein [Eubacteriales bacterium]|nr:DUF3307 domain-containing protein [Eubacteriales bacterium]
MDIYQLLILQIIAHFISDFTFQPERMATDKNNLGFKSKLLKWHIFITFITAWLFSFQIYFVFGAFTIAILHWVEDGIKKYVKDNNKLCRYSFFIDQTIHLTIIASVVLLYSKHFQLNPIFAMTMNVKSVLIIGCYIFCAKPSNIIIKETFTAFKIQTNSSGNDDLPNAGKLIGIIERFLVLTFVIINQFEAVGFLIAAKSILRFKDDNTIKTEYVLIGTMLSFGIAIALGILINLQ